MAKPNLEQILPPKSKALLFARSHGTTIVDDTKNEGMKMCRVAAARLAQGMSQIESA